MEQNPESIVQGVLEEMEAGEPSEVPDPDTDVSEFEEEGQDAKPVVRNAQFGALTDDTSSRQEGQQFDMLLDLPLVISIVLGRTKMSGSDFLKLSVGAVIELDKLAGEPLEVLVNDRKFALGEVVVVDETFGIRIVRLLDRGGSSNK